MIYDFDPEHPAANRAALLELVSDDTDLESAEIVDPVTGETLFSARKEADPGISGFSFTSPATWPTERSDSS